MVQQTQPKKFIKRLLSSKIFLLLIILILISLAVSVGRESYRKYQLAKEINKLESEIKRLEGKNQQLSNLLEYFKEESYLEKEARLKLNLKKEGEEVVIFSPSQLGGGDNSSENQSAPAVNDSAVASSPKIEANYWKWWEYFFGP